MANELLLAITILVEFVLIFTAFRAGRDWLLLAIIINLVLISALGAKLITVFGFVTNVGNIFFAAVFLSTHILVEHFGKKEGFKTAWAGLASIVVFVLMSQFAIRFSIVPETQSVAEAMEAIFLVVPRVAFASILSFVIVQHVNVWVYSFLKEKTNGARVWLRVGAATIAGQFLDSILFFTIAFYGNIPTAILTQALFIGFAIKAFVGLLGVPVVYLTRNFSPEKVKYE